MTNKDLYIPLYTDGKRDKARRYVDDSGNIISRRRYINLSKEKPISAKPQKTASYHEEAAYVPLYVDGKRDRSRRYVAVTGTIISRRKYIKLTEKTTPESKAYARYKAGKSPKGKTAKKVEKRLQKKDKREREKKKEKEKADTTRRIDETDMVAKLRAKGKRIAYHDTYQLTGMYQFYNPRINKIAESRGFSTHVKGMRYGMEFLILRDQASNFAQAQLPFSGWERVGIVWEKWLKW